jgi:transposase-like protein
MRYVEKNRDGWSASLPKHGRFIAVADAIWHRIRGKKITIYLIFLRPVHSNEATIALPVFVSGHEDGKGWEEAWKQIPLAYKRRICALVCDGQWWLIAFGFRQGWVVQRCQFHLLANLQMYLGIRDRKRNSKVLALVYALFTATNSKRSRRILRELKHIRVLSKSRGLRRVLSGLETNHRDFQSYLRYSKLNLPTTTNTAESCISGVRELMRRCRGFRSEETIRLWITGYVLWRKTIHCNGKNQQK